MIGKMIERLFVQVRADLSGLSTDLSEGVATSRRATNQMAQQWTSLGDYVQAYGNQIQQLNNRIAATAQATGVAMSPIRAQVGRAFDTTPVVNFGRSVGQSRMQMLNLGYQINDIGMTLATGANPLTVMIQQGSQILQIYGGQGGVRAAISDMGNILGGLGKRLWPLAVIASGFGILTREINKTSSTTVTFGDTLWATMEVAGRAIYSYIEGPLNRLKSGWETVLNFIAEWFPKIMNGVIGAGVFAVKAIMIAWDALPDLWHDTWATIKNTTLDAVEAISNWIIVNLVNNVLTATNRIVQAFVFAFRSVKLVWAALPNIMKDAMAGAVNFVIDGTQNLVNSVIEGFKKLFSFLDNLPAAVKEAMGIDTFLSAGTGNLDLSEWRMATSGAIQDAVAGIGQLANQTFNENFLGSASDGLDPVDLSGQQSAMRGAYSQLGRDMAAAFDQAFGTDYMGTAFEAIKSEAIANALERVSRGLADVGTAARQAADEVKEVVDEMAEGLTTAADNLSGVFGRAFEKLAETGKLTFGDFINDLNQLLIKSTSTLLQDQLSILFQGMVKNNAAGLGGLFGNLFSSLFGGGGSTLGARAGGGVAMPWQSFVAGERGAELITQDGPAGARRVSTAGRTNAMLAGSNRAPVNVTFVMPQGTDMNQFRKSQGQIASKLAIAVQRGGRNH